MFKKSLLFYFLSLTNLFANPIACPVCAVAIVSGLGISRMLGISDNVIGIWTGAILLAITNWLILFLKKKNINNIFLNIFIYVIDYLLILPLYLGENPQIIFNLNRILFIDSFLFSVLIGSLTLFCSSKLYYYMKTKNGKPHFPFEKVVLPITSLIIISIIFNYL